MDARVFVMKAMLLAAGLGMRLRPITKDTPKCLLQVNGKPLLRYHLDRLDALGVQDVVINLAWHGRQIRHYIERETNYDFKVHYSEEPPDEPLETGGGILKALPLLGDDAFMVINADVWTDYSFERLFKYQLENGVLGYLVLVNSPAGETGDYVLDNGVVRMPQVVDVTLTFSGLSVLSPRLFEGYRDLSGQEPRFPLRRLLERAARAGALRGEHYQEGDWRDVGTVERLNHLRVDQSTSGS